MANIYESFQGNSDFGRSLYEALADYAIKTADLWMIAQRPLLGVITRKVRTPHGIAVGNAHPPHVVVRNSGTERMSGAMSSKAGTGAFEGAAGVKTAKLCEEQDQIGTRLSAASVKCSGRLLEGHE